MNRLHCSIALLALTASVHAQQACYSDNAPSTTTDWTYNVTIPRFDPAMGVLTSIDFYMTGRIDGEVQVESHASSPLTVTSHFAGIFTLERPDLTALGSMSVAHDFVDNLAAYDGTQDFHGASGRTHSGLTYSVNTTFSSPPPASDLALFTGTGNITLPLVAHDLTTFTGGGSTLHTKYKQVADVQIKICYSFSKDCNHNGVADSVDIQNGMPDADNDGVPDECQPGTKDFCFGDGASNGGINCPCGNNVPSGSPRGCLNGTGNGALLVASGTPSVSADTLHLHVSSVPGGGAGYFLQGSAAQNGGSGTTFNNGIRCIGGQVIRIRKIPGGFPGMSDLPTPGGQPISVITGVTAGQTRFYQVWFRDNNGPCHLGSNTSNGVAVTWGL